jgi:hypothetical protein
MELGESNGLIFRGARTWAARDVGISGLGSNPTNPWCQRPRRSPSSSACWHEHRRGERIDEPWGV